MDVVVGAIVGAAMATLGTWLIIRRRPSERLADEQAEEERIRRSEERSKREARADAQRDQEQRRVDQLHDLKLIRRAIIAELEMQGSGSIGFQFGRGSRPSDPETQAVYWLDDDELRVQARWGNDTEWVWEEGMVPVTRSNQKQAKEVTRKPDSVAEAYRRFRFERLLVAKHFPRERLRSDWKAES